MGAERFSSSPPKRTYLQCFLKHWPIQHSSCSSYLPNLSRTLFWTPCKFALRQLSTAERLLALPRGPSSPYGFVLQGSWLMSHPFRLPNPCSRPFFQNRHACWLSGNDWAPLPQPCLKVHAEHSDQDKVSMHSSLLLPTSTVFFNMTCEMHRACAVSGEEWKSVLPITATAGEGSEAGRNACTAEKSPGKGWTATGRNSSSQWVGSSQRLKSRPCQVPCWSTSLPLPATWWNETRLPAPPGLSYTTVSMTVLPHTSITAEHCGGQWRFKCLSCWLGSNWAVHLLSILVGAIVLCLCFFFLNFVFILTLLLHRKKKKPRNCMTDCLYLLTVWTKLWC